MASLARSSFARGWVPSADAVHAPPDGVLRADNLQLDERGVLGLRRGSTTLFTLSDADVHSLYTAVLNGTRYRMAGAGNAVYANGSSLAAGLAGAGGDVAFSSWLGQILFARASSKKMYDGATVRSWGLTAPIAAPTVVVIPADTKTLATFDSGESPAFSVEEGAGGFAAGFDGTANGGLQLNPDATTGRATITKVFGSPTNFTVYDGGQVGNDDDLINFYVYFLEPQYAAQLVLRLEVNDASFTKDMYNFIWWFQAEDTVQNTPITKGWNYFQVRRGDMIRVAGATAGKDWSTVKAVQVFYYSTVGGAPGHIRFDQLRISGGNQRPLTGQQRYKAVAVHNPGTYTGLSGPSPVSADLDTTAQGVTLTITAPTVAALDPKTNEIWIFRQNDVLGDFYRVAVLTGGPFSGAQTVTDLMSDDTALETNLRLQETNTVPPNAIIGIAGPHFDRLLCLTSTAVYASQPLNPDSFDTRHVVTVGDQSETAYWIAKVREEIYIGTSKDIYRCSGDWTERPDGLINVTKQGIGVGQPPISSAFTQDGDTIFYLAADGWRQLGGEVLLTAGDVDLLYRGHTRHGVSPVNLAGGRFKAAIAAGVFTAITPEGADTLASSVLHRYVPALQRWYRHTYTPQWRALYREPDGTLIAADTAGVVWALDVGTQDAGADIPVVLWTPVDDDGHPHERKDPWDLRVRANTGGATATALLHLDGAGSHSTALNVAGSGLTPVAGSLDGIAVFRQAQLRVTGTFSVFLWYDWALTYRLRPPILVFAEPKPEARGTQRRRFTGLTLTLDTLSDPVTVTPVLDDGALPAQSVTARDVQSRNVLFPSVVGRDLWAKIAGASGFEYYGLEPIVVAVLPAPMQGRVPDTNAGSPGPKVVTGLRFRVCTLGVARTFTPIVDGATLSAFTTTTDVDEPDELTHSFTSPQLVTDLAFTVDGPIELYDWAPVVDARLPMARTLWDSGFIDLGRRAAWVTYLELKGKWLAPLTVTAYIDEVAQATQTVPLLANTPVTTYTLPLPRPVRGRQVRIRIASTNYFYLYWIEPKYRLTGGSTDLLKTRVEVAAG